MANKQSSEWRIAEVFAGTGTVARGFQKAGAFQPVVLVDTDKNAKQLFEDNFGTDVVYARRNMMSLRPGELIELAGRGGIDGLLGCPPCQGFSAAGTREHDDPRNAPVAHFFRLVSAVEPKFFVMENVPGLCQYSGWNRPWC